MCGGGGASGEECTGGMCWDCQGTGHPHLGPCGRWERFGAWCHRHELDALGWVLAWAYLSTLILVFFMPGGFEIGGLVVGAGVLLGIPVWIAMGKLGDRQMLREHERGARPVEVSQLEEAHRFVVARRETRKRRR